jgi:hypothetical protein
VTINAPFYRFFAAHRGVLFTTAVLPMHVLYYLYSAAVFGTFTVLHQVGMPLGRRSNSRAVAAAVESSDVMSSS